MRFLLLNCSSFILFENQSGMVERIFKGESKNLGSKLAFTVLCHLTSLSIRFLTCKLKLMTHLWNYFENQLNHVKKLCKSRKQTTNVGLVSAAHGHAVLLTMDKNVVFSYSFPAERKQKEVHVLMDLGEFLV